MRGLSGYNKNTKPKILYFILRVSESKEYWKGPWFKYPTNQFKKFDGLDAKVVKYILDKDDNYIKEHEA